MEKTRVLYITPHLSTGGLPQYLLTKIKENSKATTKGNILTLNNPLQFPSL